jgi:kynurenine 3-monooxygenase
MNGRMIHDPLGNTKLLPYSGRKGEYINSISRAGLNIALINEAEKYEGVRFHFNDGCVDFDCDSGDVKLASGKVATGDTVIATDGAGSAVRQAIEKKFSGFESSSVFLEHGYKELHIPPAANGDSKFAIEPNALHIWPRHQFMMIALPNFDGSFTCTLFLAQNNSPPYEGGVDPDLSGDGVVLSKGTAFDRLIDKDSLLDFFASEFPDAVPLMPTLVQDFFENPTGQLGTLRCWPWNIGGRVLLLGDAAHAMVPFYGQGMNCAFEDVRVLDSLLSQPPASAGGQVDWNSTFENYAKFRKPNTDAIQTMAEENFYEMRDATADPVFQRKRQLETRLEQEFPDYFSKYSMVTFREDLPYTTAKQIGNEQDEVLMKLCADPATTRDIPLREIFELVKRETGSTV